MPSTEYAMWYVRGPVSVVQLTHEELNNRETRDICLILLLGVTGSGKSTFVECIGNNKGLHISRDQLDGVTQELVIYRLENVNRIGGESIYLVDTPGFADDKFPEAKVLRMVQTFMDDYKLGSIKRILYFSPVTDARMTGSRDRILKILKAITGLATEKSVTIVTTMWDQLWCDRQRTRANQRFKELQQVYWKSFVEAGTPVVKFENSPKSALDTLTACMESYAAKKSFVLERMLWDKVLMANTTAGSLLYQNLLERRSGLQQRVRSLDDGLQDPSAVADPLLIQVLLEERAGVMVILDTVEQELNVLGRPSSFESEPMEAATLLSFASTQRGVTGSADMHENPPLAAPTTQVTVDSRQRIGAERSEDLEQWKLKLRRLWMVVDRFDRRRRS